MLHVDYIDNFETKALDAVRELAAEAEGADIAVAFLSFRGSLEFGRGILGWHRRLTSEG